MPQSNDQQLRIAFFPLGGTGWTAGPHYLRNLFSALRSLDYHWRPEIVLLVPHQTQSDSYSSLMSYVDELLYMPPLLGLWSRLAIRIRRRLGSWLGPEPLLASYLRKHHVDCVFSSSEFGRWFSVPLLAWIPDFQHLHLPDMFSPTQIQSRNWSLSCQGDYADRVILSSQDALRDFERFAPRSAHKARVLSFVAQLPADTYDADPAWVCDYYHLPRRFFYSPNQFWKHKNHAAVVQALALLKAQHPKVTVVCTGNTNEQRHPGYFGKLLATISERGLRDNLIILGLVPYEHLTQLMRQSLAVLQTSLFEGWSTTVEEAKSLGKQIILSDLSVHREQNPPGAVFFDPNDPEALALCLARAFEENKPGPDRELEASARAQLPERISRFGQSFVETVREVVPA